MSFSHHDPASFVVPEPRIAHIAAQLSEILSLVQLEREGQPVDVDGFRLRDLSNWVSHSTNTAMNALTPISSVCNSRCHFCFEENVPYARERSLMSREEAETRLRYYEPATGASLFPSNRNHMETFVHPFAVEIIEMARQRQPDKVFWLTTNGSHFTEPVVERLSQLKPLIFKLSLNVSDPRLNMQLMQTGARTETAIDAPRLLQKYRLPFVGGMVAWPTLPLSTLEDTVHYLADHDAYSIRIRLPLTHRWLKHQLDVDFDQHWQRVAEFAHGLRRKVSVPLIVEPPLFWLDPIVPEIDGVVRNSPAERAGLRAGDLVRLIDGKAVRTRVESEAILDGLHLAGRQRFDIVIERGGVERRVTLIELDGDTYPYDRAGFFRGENFGILHIEDFRLNHIQRMIDLIRDYSARRVLLFSSRIMAPLFLTIAESIPEFRDALGSTEVHVDVVEENSFGGNYDLMDSRVIDDYRRTIRKRLNAGSAFDLVLVPEAFGSPWGTDIYGASVADLALEFGVPVERVEWPIVYGRDV